MKATVEGINQVIRNAPPEFNKGQVSDTFHTFDELYAHRVELWIQLCRVLAQNEDHSYNPHLNSNYIWKSKAHSDGWFILGIINGGTIFSNQYKGEQTTYHLPISEWDKCYFAEELEKAPEFDGHTSQQVLERLQNL